MNDKELSELVARVADATVDRMFNDRLAQLIDDRIEHKTRDLHVQCNLGMSHDDLIAFRSIASTCSLVKRNATIGIVVMIVGLLGAVVAAGVKSMIKTLPAIILVGALLALGWVSVDRMINRAEHPKNTAQVSPR